MPISGLREKRNLLSRRIKQCVDTVQVRCDATEDAERRDDLSDNGLR